MPREFSKLEMLIISRAKLTAQIRALEKDSSSKPCLVDPFQSCIQRIYAECKDMNDGSYNEFFSYDEVFENSDDEPCEHCKAVRANKKARMKLQRERGNMNSQLTKAGKRLAGEKP